MFKTFISYLWCPISGKPKVFTKKKKKKNSNQLVDIYMACAQIHVSV